MKPTDSSSKNGNPESCQEIGQGVEQAATLAEPMPSKLDMLGKGIVTGVAVSTITQTGRTLVGRLARNPAVLFGLGFVAGYLAHKYRKQIIAETGNAAEQAKTFAIRQKDKLKNLLAEDGI